MQVTNRSLDTNHLNYLDGIRGGAAFWVMMAHCLMWGGWYPIPAGSEKLAVDIFMILSGFLMTYHYIKRDETEPIDKFSTAIKFYIRRFFRIAPAYYVSLILAFALGDLFLDGYTSLRIANPDHWVGDVTYDPKYIHYSIENFIVHATFIFGTLPQYSFSTMLPDWTLSLEMQFYLFFPILFLPLRKTRYYFVTFFLTATSIILIMIFAKLPGIRPGMFGLFPEPSFFFVKAPLFLIGILIAESIYKQNLSINYRRLLGIMAVMLSLLQVIYTRQALVIVLLSFYFLYMGFSSPNTSMFNRLSRRIIGGRVARFMADTSYSVYLFHGFFISLLGSYLFSLDGFLELSQPLRAVILFLIVSLMSYLTAYASYRFIELPFILLAKKIASRVSGPIVIPFRSSDIH